MFDHIGLRVKDLAKAKKLYEAMLKPLGYVAGASGDAYAGLGPKDSPALWLQVSKNPKAGCHVAIRAPSPAAVDKFFADGMNAGAKNNGKPGLRTDYAPTYY